MLVGVRADGGELIVLRGGARYFPSCATTRGLQLPLPPVQLQDVCYYPSCATTRYKKLLNGFTTGGRGDRGTHEEKNFYASFEKDQVPMCIELPLGQNNVALF